MGKKGKRAGKAGTAVAKQGPGKARRERAVAFKDFEKRLDALTETLEADLQGEGHVPTSGRAEADGMSFMSQDLTTYSYF